MRDYPINFPNLTFNESPINFIADFWEIYCLMLNWITLDVDKLKLSHSHQLYDQFPVFLGII